jgi:hypothetical protein
VEQWGLWVLREYKVPRASVEIRVSVVLLESLCEGPEALRVHPVRQVLMEKWVPKDLPDLPVHRDLLVKMVRMVFYNSIISTFLNRLSTFAEMQVILF